MIILTIIATALSAYFAKEAYDQYRLGWAVFWSVLLGWDLHSLITYL
jgi:hypothetical protein